MGKLGRIICLEGIDGCGKGTIAAKLAANLGAALYKFPDANTLLGETIYAHLDRLWQARVNWPEDRRDWDQADRDEPVKEKLRAARWPKLADALVFQALQTANRLELAPLILAAQRSGQDVVLDRYWPSGVVYGAADGLDREWLIKLHRALPQPDLFLLLDIDVEDSVRRRSGRRDRYEADEHMTARVKAYRELWGEFGGLDSPVWAGYGFQSPHPSWHVIDARDKKGYPVDQSVSYVFSDVMDHVMAVRAREAL